MQIIQSDAEKFLEIAVPVIPTPPPYPPTPPHPAQLLSVIGNMYGQLV